ncbi:TenA family protein [Aerosakkonemataceae cyanobacterium BLCC-F154]|uniref:TenA family protein n=1 Tax=Floridaenema fluviatile BLCC-F154 TaxID=3153640 RepID=A0ABV4YFT3_9CYAN
MTLSQQLWQANQTLAQACLAHPFVQGIATGTLPKNRFAYYVGQDAFFLEAFAKAYSLAGVRSPNWESFQIFHNLAGGVLQELKLHQSYAAKWEVNLLNVSPSPATRRYTDFLLATAWNNPAGLTAVAMAPCMRLYAFLGQELAKNGIPKHQYSDWICTYSSPEFLPLATELETLVDRYVETKEIAEPIYHYAMLCEYEFFQSAWSFPEKN